MNLADIFPPKGHLQRNYCDKCKTHLDLSYKDFDEEVSGIRISLKGLPVLLCTNCSSSYLPDRSRFALIELHRRAMTEKSKSVTVTRNKITHDFKFTKLPFQYDSDDYYYIPGLRREFDEGYLTPVFFKKEALIKYDVHPSYRVSFASRTYGNILHDDSFSIPFGVNKFGRLVMWLGDVATLPENEQYYLLSENVISDHSIGSEFYDGQIECIFTERTPEDQLLEKRSQFLEACFNRFGKKIAHLDNEVLALAINVRRPLVDTMSELKNVADSLNKIYIESLDNKQLEQILISLGHEAKSLGGLKRLQKILEVIDAKSDIATLMCPFYVLYDLRISHLHLGSDEGLQEKMDFICQRLSIPKGADAFVIYDKLVFELTSTFDKLTSIVK